MSIPLLFTPLTLRGLTLRNRVVLSPMCQYQAIEGRVQDWHHQHHARFATGGLALGFVEATGVTRDGRITHGCTGIWEDGQIAGLRRIVDLYHEYGAACGIQIGHAGRRASAERPWDGAAPIQRTDGPEAAWQRVGPSAVPERDGYPAPRALTESEIEDLIGAFVSAHEARSRRRLRRARNPRRARLSDPLVLLAGLQPAHRRVRRQPGKTHALPPAGGRGGARRWPEDKPLFYRTSSVDGIEGGVTIEDTVALAQALKARGIDLIDCSSGGMSGPATLSSAKITPGYQVPYAAAVRRQADLPTMAVGAILEPRHAEDILAAGDADLIAIGRQLIAEPHWLYRAALELGLPEPASVLPRNYGFYLARSQ